MSTVKGTKATLYDAGGVSTIEQGLVNVPCMITIDDYTVDGATEVIGTVIKLFGKLPKNARLHTLILDIDANQTSVTLDIGDAEDADRYAAADTSHQTAGCYIFDLNEYQCDETDEDNTDRQITLTVGGATMSAANLRAKLLYTMA